MDISDRNQASWVIIFYMDNSKLLQAADNHYLESHMLHYDHDSVNEIGK